MESTLDFPGSICYDDRKANRTLIMAVTTYKRSKKIWDHYLPKAKFYLRGKKPASELHFLRIISMFFRKYDLRYDMGNILTILRQHGDMANYQKISHDKLCSKLTLLALRSELGYPNLV